MIRSLANTGPCNRGFRHTLFLAIVVLQLCSSCTTVTSELTQTPADIVQIQVKIKSALIDSETLRAAAIRVEVEDKVVLLSGFVGSEAESDLATSLAQQNAPDFVINNRLVIR